jgi:MFS family permease
MGADVSTPSSAGIRAVWRTPGAAPLIAASLVAAIPAGAIGVLLVLHVRALHGSYALAGVTASAYMVGAAASAPAVGRAVDHFGQTRVLTLATLVTASALLGLAVVPGDVTPALPIALALIGGLCAPPVGACTRTLLPDVIDDDDTLHAAYALESSGLEISYIAGLVFVGLLTLLSTRLALGIDALMLAIGIAWFVAQPASRQWRPTLSEQARRSALGALASGRVVVLFVTITLFAVSFGAMEVSVNAFASEHGSSGATGPLVALWGVGSLIGGLIAASSVAPVDAPRRVIALLLVMALADAVLIVLSGSWLLVAMLPIAGLAIAPVYAVIHAMTGLAAAAGTSTEAFAWLGTGTSAGFAAGAALAGALADAGGAQAAFIGVTAAVVVSAAVFSAGWRLVAGVSETVAPAD